MGKKSDRIKGEIYKFIEEITKQTMITPEEVLDNLLDDLNENKKEKSYPNIQLSKFFGIEGGKERVKQILQEILENFEKENEQEYGDDYYKEIRRYTQGFKFLIEDPSMTFANYGHRTIEKENYEQRFSRMIHKVRMQRKEAETEEDLINIQKRESEEDLLERFLLENKIRNKTDRRILEERLQYIIKEKEREKEVKNNEK